MEVVRAAAAEALAALLAKGPRQASQVLNQLLEQYKLKLELSLPVVGANGRVVQEAIDFWEPMSCIALTLAKLSP